MSIQDLNNLIGIAADIKASDIAVGFNPGQQGFGDDTVRVDMKATFSWYSTPLGSGELRVVGAKGQVVEQHDTVDDNGDEVDADADLDKQSMVDFAEKHYPPAPQFYRVNGGTCKLNENGSAEITRTRSAITKKLCVGPHGAFVDDEKTSLAGYMDCCTCWPDGKPGDPWERAIDGYQVYEFKQYKVTSAYTFEKNIEVTGRNLPMDMYGLRFELDLCPITIYRLTPTVGNAQGACTAMERATNRAMALVKSVPLDEDGKVHAYHVCFGPYCKDTIKRVYTGGKDLSDADKEAHAARMAYVVAKQINLRQMLKLFMGPDFADEGDQRNACPMIGVTLKKIKFHPKVKPGYKTRWMQQSDEKEEDKRAQYNFVDMVREALKYPDGEDARVGMHADYHPHRITHTTGCEYSIIYRTFNRSHWPKLTLRTEHAENILRIEDEGYHPDQNSVALEITVCRSFVPAVLSVQVPLWTILLLLPFAWTFVHEGKGDAYSYLAALLLAVVAHRNVIDACVQNVRGVTSFDIEYASVMLVLLLTTFAMMASLEFISEAEAETIFFAQLGATAIYVGSQLSRLAFAMHYFEYAANQSNKSVALASYTVNLFGSADLPREKPQEA